MTAICLPFTASPALSFLGVRYSQEPFQAERTVLMTLYCADCHPAAHRHAIRFDNENTALPIPSGISGFTEVPMHNQNGNAT